HSRLFHCSVIKVRFFVFFRFRCRISDSSFNIAPFFPVVNNNFQIFQIFFNPAFRPVKDRHFHTGFPAAHPVSEPRLTETSFEQRRPHRLFEYALK
ncbi:hypothetical protein AALB53_22155, partial [Lachnospiraceae bacterium 47-T17]